MKKSSREMLDENSQAARPQHDLAASPCAACPVRPLSICSGLSIDELSDLEKIVTSVVVKAGAPIFDEGEAATYRYNLTSGCVRIYKLLGDTGTISPVAVFGYTSYWEMAAGRLPVSCSPEIFSG
jgi:CRP-like cAMP-binding protein